MHGKSCFFPSTCANINTLIVFVKLAHFIRLKKLITVPIALFIVLLLLIRINKSLVILILKHLKHLEVCRDIFTFQHDMNPFTLHEDKKYYY